MKERSSRLGGGGRCVKNIREHAFFNRVSWKRVSAMKEASPPVPQVAAKTDARYFDPEIRGEHKSDVNRFFGLARRWIPVLRGVLVRRPDVTVDSGRTKGQTQTLEQELSRMYALAY